MLAEEIGYDACYILPVDNYQDLPEGVNTVVILLKTYLAERLPDKENAAIHPYNFASQQAYQMAKDMAKHIESAGEACEHLANIPLKPLLLKLNGFVQRRNTLVYHNEWGSRFHVQALGLKNRPSSDYVPNVHQSVLDVCGSCELCIKACPTGAIGKYEFDMKKCLRLHMLSSNSTPQEFREAMGNQLVGCDHCQAVCPHNVPPSAPIDTHSWHVSEMLPPSSEFLKNLKLAIGSNLAKHHRICAQACIVAGNSKSLKLLALLTPLSDHPSAVVADHAQWAIQQIQKSQENDKFKQ